MRILHILVFLSSESPHGQSETLFMLEIQMHNHFWRHDNKGNGCTNLRRPLKYLSSFCTAKLPKWPNLDHGYRGKNATLPNGTRFTYTEVGVRVQYGELFCHRARTQGLWQSKLSVARLVGPQGLDLGEFREIREISGKLMGTQWNSVELSGVLYGA